MDAQIKEDIDDACFETPGDELGSLTLIEKYDRFLLGQDIDSDPDSDGDFFPNETILREEYAQMRRATNHYVRTNNNHRLSFTSLPSKYKNFTDNDISVVDEEPRNGSEKHNITESIANSSSTDNTTSKDSDIASLDKLIEHLNNTKKYESDWKNISCTEEELENICETYGKILDYIYNKSITSFEKSNSTKDSESQQNEEDVEEDVEVKENSNENHKLSIEHSEDKKLLAEKIKLVKIARDKYYEVEQQVREHIEQLELVERYKMESVG